MIKWLITLSVMFPAFIECMDTSVVNVTLDHIRGTMSAGIDESAWAITSYIISNAIIMPMSDWLSRMFGRKRYLIFSVALFTASSVLCGLSWSLNSLILFRVLQGIGGGALVPLSQTILYETFSEKERGIAMAVFGTGVTLAPSVGLPLGGWIADNWMWRWIFYINLPIGIISILMILAYIKDPPYMKIEKQKIDTMGISLLVIGIAALQIVLDRGQREDWFSSDFILILSIVCVVSLILLVIRELSINNPVIDLRVFKNVSFSSGTTITFITFFTMMSLFVLTPLYVQAMLGYTATLAGMVMMPQGFCMMLSLGVAGMLCSKINPKTLLVLGMLGFAYSAKLMAGFNTTTDFQTVVLAMCFLGISAGFIFVPLSILCFTGIGNDKMGNATALWNLLRNIGGSIGIAVVMTFISRGAQIHQQYLVDHMTLLDKGYRLMLERVTPLLDLKGYGGSAEGTIYGELVRQAMMLSFVDVYNLLMFMMLAVIPLVIFMKNGKGKGNGNGNGQTPSVH